jgi:putative hydrolase of the HAD superfamily
MDLYSFKAVFFDVGGTLINPYPSVGDIYVKHARNFGFKGDVKDIDQQFGIEWKNTGGLESLGNQSGEAVEKKFWHDIVFDVFKPFGGVEDFETYFETIYEAFKSADNWKVFDDVLESGVLQKLKDRGITLGVLSNWDSRLTPILENVGLAQYFDFILASASVGSAKPDSKIFQEGLRLSGVQPNQVCHIGDEVKTDVTGARSLGIHPVLIDRKSRFPDEKVHKISSFCELV